MPCLRTASPTFFRSSDCRPKVGRRFDRPASHRPKRAKTPPTLHPRRQGPDSCGSPAPLQAGNRRRTSLLLFRQRPVRRTGLVGLVRPAMFDTLDRGSAESRSE
jgi:hypothetical protein